MTDLGSCPAGRVRAGGHTVGPEGECDMPRRTRRAMLGKFADIAYERRLLELRYLRMALRREQASIRARFR